MNLRFQTIDLEAHGELAARYREDSYVVSFGSAEGFERMGAQAYLEWLRHQIEAYPAGHVHVWLGEDIVGQIEARPHKTDPTIGYVNLYYVAPGHRRRGIGGVLDDYVTRHFSRQGRTQIHLSVSPTNEPAWAFYLDRGYVDCGQREDSPEVHRMERRLASSMRSEALVGI